MKRNLGLVQNKKNILRNLLDQASLVIFDMNGLIVNDEPVQRRAFNFVLREYKVSISEKEWMEECAGHKATEIFARVLTNAGIKSRNSFLEQLKEKKNVEYKKIIKKEVKKLYRLPIKNIFSYLFETKKTLAIATSGSKEEVEIILGKSGLNIKKYFSYIVTGEEVKHGKPHPEIYRKIARIAKRKPNKCLVFEDTEAGVMSAWGAKMQVVAVPSRFTRHQDFSKANLIL